MMCSGLKVVLSVPSLLVIALLCTMNGAEAQSSISCYTCDTSNQTDCGAVSDRGALAKYSEGCAYGVQQCITSFWRVTQQNGVFIERITRGCSPMYEFNLPEEGLCSLHPTMSNDRSWRSCWCSTNNCNDYNNLRGTTPDIMSISMLPSNKFFGPYEAAYRM